MSGRECTNCQAQKKNQAYIGSLWIQEFEKDRRLKFHKVAGVANCADLMTKNVPRQTREVHMRFIGQGVKVGRAEAGLQLTRGAGQGGNDQMPKF